MSASVGLEVEAIEERGSSKMALVLVVVALFLAAIDSTIVSTLIPTILADMGGDNYYPWLISGYIASGVMAAPIAGALSDRFNEKRIMLLALGIFGLGMALAYLAPDIRALIAARVIQGLGAGAIITLSYTLIGALYGAKDRGKMQGLLSGVWGLSAILGPVLGALLVSFLSWRAVFLLHVPLVMGVFLAFAFSYRLQGAKRNTAPFSLLANLGFSTLLLFLLALVQLPSLGLEQYGVELLALVFVAAATYLYAIYKKPDLDVLPRQFFSTLSLMACALLTVIASSTLYASVTILPLALSSLSHANVVDHGAVVFAAAMGWVIGSAFCGARLVRIGYRGSALIGAMCLVTGSGLLALLHPASATNYFMLAQVFVGLGIGFIATTSLVYIQNSAPAASLGRFTSAAQLFRNIGAAVGVNLIAAIQIYAASKDPSVNSYSISFTYLFVLTLVSFVFVFWLPRKERK